MIVYKIDCFSPNSSSFKHCVRVVDQVFLFSFLKRVFWWLYVPLVHVWVEPFNLSRTESTNSYNRRVSSTIRLFIFYPRFNQFSYRTTFSRFHIYKENGISQQAKGTSPELLHYWNRIQTL